MKLFDLQPAVYAEFQQAFKAATRADLAAQLAWAELSSYDFDNESGRIVLNLRYDSAAPPVQPALEGAHRATLERTYRTTAHVDATGRLQMLELLDGRQLAEALGRISPLQL